MLPAVPVNINRSGKTWLDNGLSLIASTKPTSEESSRKLLSDFLATFEKDDNSFVVIPMICGPAYVNIDSLRKLVDVKAWIDDDMMSYGTDHILGLNRIYNKHRSYYDAPCEAYVIGSLLLTKLHNLYRNNTVEDVDEEYKAAIGNLTPRIIIIIENVGTIHWACRLYVLQTTTPQGKVDLILFDSHGEDRKESEYGHVIGYLERTHIGEIVNQRQQILARAQRDTVNCGLYVLDWLQHTLPTSRDGMIIASTVEYKLNENIAMCRHERLWTMLNDKPIYRDLRRFGFVPQGFCEPFVQECVKHLRRISQGEIKSDISGELTQLTGELVAVKDARYMVWITPRMSSMTSFIDVCWVGYYIDDMIIDHCLDLLTRKYSASSFPVGLIPSVEGSSAPLTGSIPALHEKIEELKDFTSHLFIPINRGAEAAYTEMPEYSVHSSHWTIWYITEHEMVYFDSMIPPSETRIPITDSRQYMVKSIREGVFPRAETDVPARLATITNNQDSKASCAAFVIEWVRHVCEYGSTKPFTCDTSERVRMHTIQLILNPSLERKESGYMSPTPTHIITTHSSIRPSTFMAAPSSAPPRTKTGSVYNVYQSEITAVAQKFVDTWATKHSITPFGHVTDGIERDIINTWARDVSGGKYVGSMKSGGGSSAVYNFNELYTRDEGTSELTKKLRGHQKSLFSGA
jgi:hypothetical protein